MLCEPATQDDLSEHFDAWPLYTVFRVRWDYGGWSPLLIKVSDTHAQVLEIDPDYDDGKVASWSGKYNRFERVS